MTRVLANLASLPAHAIFGSGDKKQDDWELVDKPADGLVGSKLSRMVLNDKDLIVASGSEVRSCSLAGQSWDVKDGKVGTHQTAKAECLNFTIHSLVLSPTGRLLAVVGEKQVAVLALPSLSPAFAIDEFEYSASSSATISKVAWHPLGEAGESLWILTSDGRLQEYDIRNPDDPAQTFTFLPQATTSSSSKFTAVDPLSRHATSFAFHPLSASTYDFAPLVVHVLIANGDLYTMGPILPLRAEVSRRYLQGLKGYVKECRRRAEAKKDEDELDKLDSWETWVDDLARQAASGPGQNDTIKLHPPHLTSTGGPASGSHKALLRQGPVIYSPAPKEADDEDEDNVASDIIVLSMPRHEEHGEEDEEASSSGSVGAVGIAWSSGRVDIGLLADAQEPAWVDSHSPQQVPTVPILESIYLTPSNTGEEGAEIAPACSVDVLYRDTFYVQQANGVSRINIRPLVDSTLHGEPDATGSDVSELVSTDRSASQAIVGSAGFCNISFGYGRLALTAQGQLASTELDFRAVGPSMPMTSQPKPDADVPSTVDNRSLLAKSLDITALITQITQPKDYNPHALVRSRPDSRTPLTEINASQLKLLGDITSQIRKRTEAIRAASQTIENRLDLQVKEYQRQLRVLNSARSEMKGVTSAKSSEERVDRIADNQRKLADRLDKVVGKAMASHTGPDLSDSERKYLEELQKTRDSLTTLGKQFANVQKDVEKVRKEVNDPENAPPRSRNDADASDLRQLRAQADAEAEEIRKLFRKMDRFSVRVEAAKIEGEESD